MTGFPPLMLRRDGAAVAGAAQWPQRRAELLDDLQRTIYGYLPRPPAAAPRATTRLDDPRAFGGAARLRVERLEVLPGLGIDLVLSLPARLPAPVMVGLNFRGNHDIANHPGVPPARGFTLVPPPSEVWPLAVAARRGWAVATVCYGDLFPDVADPAARASLPGLQQVLRSEGPHGWGAIAAWAWGLQRIVDHLVTRPEIDPRRIVLTGHSRLGKTALLAGATDPRVALVVASQSGTLGAAPSRQADAQAESVRAIATRFPHWFCPALVAAKDHPESLPVDQHALLAAIAPRPLLLSNATDDAWANPPGQFELLRLASDAWRLLGADGLSASGYPEEGRLVASRCGWFRRAGAHCVTAMEWSAWLDFAEVHLGTAM
jgi:hypothetical protein